MDLIRKMIPCTFCSSHNHCVADCWKQKVYGRKIMATRSTPRRDDVTLQVKKNLRTKSTQPRQESEKSKGDSAQSGHDSIKFLRARNTCSHCQKNGHCEDNCWKLHSGLRCSTKPVGPEQKKDVAERLKVVAEEQKDAARGKQDVVAEEQRNDHGTPLAGDGSSSWNWADFMPYM
jgi:hypothetical protein